MPGIISCSAGKRRSSWGRPARLGSVRRCDTRRVHFREKHCGATCAPFYSGYLTCSGTSPRSSLRNSDVLITFEPISPDRWRDELVRVAKDHPGGVVQPRHGRTHRRCRSGGRGSRCPTRRLRAIESTHQPDAGIAARVRACQSCGAVGNAQLEITAAKGVASAIRVEKAKRISAFEEEHNRAPSSRAGLARSTWSIGLFSTGQISHLAMEK